MPFYIFKDSTPCSDLGWQLSTFSVQLDRKIEIERRARAVEGRSEGGLRKATADDKMGCWVAALQALSAVVTTFNNKIEREIGRKECFSNHPNSHQ